MHLIPWPFRIRSAMQRLLTSLSICLFLSGCSALPDIVHQPQYHNPFPQLSRVAVLPFYNQSAEPTVDSDAVALAYYNELQAIPGFEVVPVGVAKLELLKSGIEPRHPDDFRELARRLGVDAIVAGSITEYSAYYPPRMGLSVRWYAANPGFHPIPPGYGLPWGTPQEEFIPDDLVFEAEFALAKEQLKTQTPEVAMATITDEEPPTAVRPASASQPSLPQSLEPTDADAMAQSSVLVQPSPQSRKADESSASRPESIWVDGPGIADTADNEFEGGLELPPDWPDPRGFVPLPPAPTKPAPCPQNEPVITHTRLYHGQDADFTRRLASYYYFRDDARFGGWQGYLERSDDFIRFCCHLHITEMLTARGGAGETRVVWRWPIRRYER